MSSLSRLAKLRWAERALLLECICLLPMIGLALRVLGFRRVRSVLARQVGRGPVGARKPDTARVESVARIAGIAARRGPYRASCLEDSLLLWWLLRRRGVETRLRFGVNTDGGELHAHSWLELDGRVLNDAPDVGGRYAPFARDPGSGTAESR